MILNEDAKIRIVYHIGDIHVRRNNDRDKEYTRVFEKLYLSLKDDCKESLIVCVGDVFNDGLSPSAIVLVKNLFIKLTDLCDVVVFRGNHDQTNKSNPE